MVTDIEVDNVNYFDVTNEWVDNAIPNSHEIIIQSYYIHNEVKYKVDGKNVIFKPDKNELEVAIWLKETLGGEIILLPRVNNPSGIKTPDYLFRGKKFDLKVIVGRGKNVLYSNIYGKEKQAHNFIIDITKTLLSVKKIKEQIEYVYRRNDISWLNILIIKKGDNIVGIYKRKN